MSPTLKPLSMNAYTWARAKASCCNEQSTLTVDLSHYTRTNKDFDWGHRRVIGKLESFFLRFPNFYR